MPYLAILSALLFQAPLMAQDLKAPRLEVVKSKRELSLLDGDQLIKTYRVGLGGRPEGPKEHQGDEATPEGSYYICLKNPKSRYHLSLGISYPGPADAKRGLKAGLISRQNYNAIIQAHQKHRAPPWNTALGGEVFVHGNGGKSDWTLGCIALDDADIEELYRLVPLRTVITIYP